MAKMLDLTVLQESYFPIKLLDGATIRLKKPSQGLLLQFIAFKNIQQANLDEQFDAITKLTAAILSNNAEGRTFTAADLNEYDLVILQAIIQGYIEFLNEVMANPN